MKDSRRANTVTSSLAIIEVVADCGVGVTAKEIADRLGMAPATAYRLINALVADEFLVRTADLRGFGLGVRLRGLAEAMKTSVVTGAARQCLTEFRESTRFAVHLMNFRPDTVQVISEDPDHPVLGERELVRYPHASAAGKLLLASRTQWRAMVPEPVRVTTHTHIDHGVLAEEIRMVREAGFAQAVNELVAGLACLAYPIYNETGTVEGALCISGPSSRVGALLGHDAQARSCAKELGPLLY
ncbi:IclR family transcriptional regulator [Nocardia sp. NBC_01327]|uniref:IclR family transcriptional regulator n=1 Tax=Nocardia sp. NBC_01327 TaxID=2903593 RepID=UPI002E10A3DE|nr:helix-turn-helix domain-containing protein [Nocardia sp. NBC_01327]